MHNSDPRPSVVVVFTPYLHHDGSSLLLCRFLRWAAARRPDVSFEVIYTYDGPLRQTLLSLPNVGSVRPLHPLRRRIVHHIQSRLEARRMASQLRNADAIYCNTVVGLQSLQTLMTNLGLSKDDLPRTCVHLRELGYWIQRSGISRHTFQTLPDVVVADSQLTARHLSQSIDLPSLTVIDEYCDTEEIVRWRGCDQIRKEFNIPTDRPIVGMSGTIEWRKGPDLFLLIARELAGRMENPPLFVWVGGGDPTANYQMASDIKRMGLESMVLLPGPKDNPYPYYDSFDVFLLSSREEPFGAVCLEAAMLSIPSLCFAGCAGAETFIASGAGVVVDRFDIGTMASALQDLLQNDEGRARAGEQARRVCLNEHAFDVLLPRLLAQVLGVQPEPSVKEQQHR